MSESGWIDDARTRIELLVGLRTVAGATEPDVRERGERYRRSRGRTGHVDRDRWLSWQRA